MKRKISLAFRKLGLPFLQSPDWILLQSLRKQLANVPRYTKGKVTANGWNLEYADAPSLVSAVECVVFKRWNDFITDKENPVILDCGANIGVSVIHYKKMFPKAKITAFEPDHDVCEILRRNLLENDITDVEIVEAAIWKENGETEFFSEGADAGRLDNNENDIDSLVGKTPKGSKVKVKTVRLAEYIADSPVDFIKLDIEGAESNVMEDCADNLSNIKSMVIEFHLTNSRPNELAVVMKALSDAKFNVSVNSYGKWINLINKDSIKHAPVEFDQYLLLNAWH